MSRTNRAAKGFVTAIFQYLTRIMVQILLAPLVLVMAGKETLGAYAAIMQTLGLFLMINISGSWSLDRFLAQSTGRDDDGKRFRETFTISRTIQLLTNTVFAVMVLILSHFAERLLHLTPGIARQARYALYVIAAWAVASTPFWSYEAALVAKQHIAEVNLIRIVVNIATSVGTLLAVVFGGGLFGMMVAATLVGGVFGFIYRFRFQKYYPNLKPGWGVPDWKLMRQMMSFGGYTVFMNIGNKLFLSSANLLASVTSGATAASTFYTTQTPGLTGYNLLYRLTESSTPAVHELYGRGEMDRLRHVFSRLVRLMLMMTTPLALGIFLFNKDVVTCWVGPAMYAGPLLTDTLAVYLGMSALLSLSILFSYVFGWVRLLAVIAFLQGVANVAVGYYLGKKLGLGGITLALALLLVPQMIILLVKVSRSLKLNTARVIAGVVLRSMIPLALAAAAGLYVHSHVYIARHHFGGLIAESLAFAGIYAVGAYFIVMHRQDQADARRYLSGAVQYGRKLHGKLFGAA